MSTEHKLHMNGRLVRDRGPVELSRDSKVTFDDLGKLGITFDSAIVGPAAPGGYIPEEFLQTWLPGTIRALTSPTDIDYIAGVTTIGDWSDETLNVKVSEPVGKAERYGDYTNVPLANFKTDFEVRQVVRFEQGLKMAPLEQARYSKIDIDGLEEKRRAIAESLDYSRNMVGMRGIAGTRTYGLLNDPNLSAVRTTSINWLTATHAQLVSEFTALYGILETQMGKSLRDDAQLVFVLPTGYRAIMNVENSLATRTFGDWLKVNYPNLRVEYAPSFKGASAAGEDIGYLIAENIANLDASNINGATLIQAVPARYQVIGSSQDTKGYIESVVNATAGVIVLRPWGVARTELDAQ